MGDFNLFLAKIAFYTTYLAICQPQFSEAIGGGSGSSIIIIK
jgi:hypothetical protein